MTSLPSHIALAPDDDEGFALWVQPHLAAMARLAARIAPESDRDDIVQEALVRAWQKRGQFNPNRGTPAAWLLALTADKASKARKQVRSHVRWYEVEGQAARIEGDVDLEDAVARLSKRQRLAVDCYYIVGLSVAETAAVMRCAEGTVKSTLADARDRLRTMIGLEQ